MEKLKNVSRFFETIQIMNALLKNCSRTIQNKQFLIILRIPYSYSQHNAKHLVEIKTLIIIDLYFLGVLNHLNVSKS